MKRACSVRRAGARDQLVSDRVVLDADQRQRRRVVLVGEKGTRFLLDLPQPGRLRDGDALVLEDDAIIEVVSRLEPLAELRTVSLVELVRLAWHLGNRHVDLQVGADHLRIRRDHVIEGIAMAFGATVTPINAAFEPEWGAHSHAAES